MNNSLKSGLRQSFASSALQLLSLRSTGWEIPTLASHKHNPRPRELGKAAAAALQFGLLGGQRWLTLAGHFNSQLCCSGHPIRVIFFSRKMSCVSFACCKAALEISQTELENNGRNCHWELHLPRGSRGSCTAWLGSAGIRQLLHPPHGPLPARGQLSAQREGTFTSCHLPVSGSATSDSRWHREGAG